MKPEPRQTLARVGSREYRRAQFPLTPTLSPGERESRRPAFAFFRRCDLVDARPMVLPLLGGEGWGEGERGSRLQGCDSRLIAP